jgi:hypothetical protein
MWFLWFTSLRFVDNAEELRNALDADDLVNDDHVIVVNDCLPNGANHGVLPTPFIALAAQSAKAHFGVPERTRANELCVRDFIRKFMLDKRHRPSHIARDLPMAVELTFVPSEAELSAMYVRSSYEMRLRTAEYLAIRGHVQDL